MATANDIINRAMRRIGVLAEGEAMSATGMVNALAAFNDMLHGFNPMGINYAHTTLTATDTVNFPDEQLRNVMLLFAKDQADEYQMPISGSLASDINRALLELQSAYHVQAPPTPEPMLRNRRFGYFNISRGE